MQRGPFSQRWVSEHRDFVEGQQFRDVQISGPFACWEHTHRVEPDGPSACYLEDAIEYALPCGMVGKMVASAFVRHKLERLFTYRHHVTVHDIVRHRARRGEGPMKVLVTGASGLVGSTLVPFLTTGGHQVTRLVRSRPQADAADVQWDPLAGSVNTAALEGLDAVVHLAGENIAAGRWTVEQKAKRSWSRIPVKGGSRREALLR
jgi:hypothetical protein